MSEDESKEMQLYADEEEVNPANVHWNLARVYESEEERKDVHRAVYNFRLSAFYGHPEAGRRLGEYSVSVTGPRKMSFTNEELQFFLKQFSRENSETLYVTAPPAPLTTATPYVGASTAATENLKAPPKLPRFSSLPIPVPFELLPAVSALPFSALTQPSSGANTWRGNKEDREDRPDWEDVTLRPLILESDGKRFDVPLEWEERFRRAPTSEGRYILLDELEKLGKKFVDDLKRERQDAYYERMHQKTNLSPRQKVTIRGRIHSKLNPFIKKQTIETQRVIQQFLVRQIQGSGSTVHNDSEAVAIELSKSGLPEDRRFQLSEMARKDFEGWKVNVCDIEFTRKSTGDRRRIGKGGGAEVYLARMKMRDENGDVIEGQHKEVAVKQFTVLRSRAKCHLPLFLREILLQKNARHPCVVETLGGYWPDPEEVEDEEEIEPWIVMERMNYNLIQVLDRQLLKTLDSKRRILADVAEGIAHLHSCCIVHRDIKPENVLLRVVDGHIVGRAKVCDFGVSRKAEETMTVTMDSLTRPNGTSLYMPPEAFLNSAQQGSKRARDIWSFGVLMCEVLLPDFLLNIGNKHHEGAHAVTGNGQFAKEIAQAVRDVQWEGALRDLAVSCLSLDPKQRPKIDEVLDTLLKPVVGS